MVNRFYLYKLNRTKNLYRRYVVYIYKTMFLCLWTHISVSFAYIKLNVCTSSIKPIIITITIIFIDPK